MIQKDKRCQLSYPLGSKQFVHECELDIQDGMDRGVSACMVLCFISLKPPREKQIYGLTIALCQLKQVKG